MSTVEELTDYTNQLLQHVQLPEAQVDVEEDGEYIHLQITVDDSESGILIGHHGDTIASIQRLINVSFLKKLDGKRVVVNVNDYKQQRESVVLAMTERYAERLRTTGEPQALPYLPANERLIIHMAFKEDPEIETFSEGEGRQRKLILQLTNTVED